MWSCGVFCSSQILDVCFCCWLVFPPLIQSWQLLKASHKLHPAAPSPPGREPFNKRSRTRVCVCVIVFASVQSVSLFFCVYPTLNSHTCVCAFM